MRGLVLVFLAACDGGPSTDDDGEPERNGLSVVFAMEDVPSALRALTLRVEEVVLEGDGPSGPASISAEVGRELAVWGGSGDVPDLGLELEVGRWRDVTLTLALAEADGVPAVRATGELLDGPFELRVPTLAFADRGAFELGAGLDPTVVFEVENEDWVEVLEESDGERTDGVLLVDPTHNAALYDAVVAELLDATEADFPGEDD